MNREQAEAAARVIMEAETRRLEEVRQRLARKQILAARRQRLAMFAAGGYFTAIGLAAVFGWSTSFAGVMGFVTGLVTGWWRARRHNDGAM